MQNQDVQPLVAPTVRILAPDIAPGDEQVFPAPEGTTTMTAKAEALNGTQYATEAKAYIYDAKHESLPDAEPPEGAQSGQQDSSVPDNWDFMNLIVNHTPSGRDQTLGVWARFNGTWHTASLWFVAKTGS